MSVYIGSVTFRDPLHLVDKGNPNVTGKDVLTRSGDLVMVRPVSTAQTYRLLKATYRWTTWADVETLQTMAQSAAGYSADLEGTGNVVTVYFQAEGKGMEPPKHEKWGDNAPKGRLDGTPADLYTGTLNLVVVG